MAGLITLSSLTAAQIAAIRADRDLMPASDVARKHGISVSCAKHAIARSQGRDRPQ